jgi:hypothetical protein
MDLISNHVFQALIIGWSKENHHFQLFSSEPVIHDFISMPLITKFVESSTNVIDTLTLEWSCVTFISVKRGYFTQYTLN